MPFRSPPPPPRARPEALQSPPIGIGALRRRSKEPRAMGAVQAKCQTHCVWREACAPQLASHSTADTLDREFIGSSNRRSRSRIYPLTLEKTQTMETGTPSKFSFLAECNDGIDAGNPASRQPTCQQSCPKQHACYHTKYSRIVRPHFIEKPCHRLSECKCSGQAGQESQHAYPQSAGRYRMDHSFRRCAKSHSDRHLWSSPSHRIGNHA